jgi:heat-inducible transcriptional repressor
MTRQDEILKYIVEYFIKTAEPVGSKTLMEAYGLAYSSATIRNEMNALEKLGYIEKTHTSSGRVPSEKGYQYYVEHLREGSVDQGVKNALQAVLSERAKSVEEVMKESCEILSHMTNLASVVLGAAVDEERLQKVQIIPLGANTATAVFVTDKGYVENKTFVIPDNVAMTEVEKNVSFLNDRLVGTPISQLVAKMEAMKPAITDYMVGEKVLYQALLEAFVKFTGERMALYGKDALFNQPDFAKSAEKLKKVLSLLDNPAELRKAVKDSKATPTGVKVHIGSFEDGMEDVSLVSARLNVPGASDALLTLLGPSRMDYESVVATLEYATAAIDKYFSNQKKGGQLVLCQTKIMPPAPCPDPKRKKPTKTPAKAKKK